MEGIIAIGDFEELEYGPKTTSTLFSNNLSEDLLSIDQGDTLKIS